MGPASDGLAEHLVFVIWHVCQNASEIHTSGMWLLERVPELMRHIYQTHARACDGLTERLQVWRFSGLEPDEASSRSASSGSRPHEASSGEASSGSASSGLTYHSQVDVLGVMHSTNPSTLERSRA